MGLKDYQRKIIQQFETQELLLAALYAEFGRRFSADAAFWERLVREETMHAQLLAKLRTAVEKGVMVFDEGKVKTYTLSAMIERIEDLVQRARRGDLTRNQALAQAMDLEAALIEKGVFTHFEPLNEKARAVLKRLQAETRDHVERVRRMRDDMGPKPSPLPAPPPASAPEPRIAWTPSLATGIEDIDVQHRHLLDLTNRAAALKDDESRWKEIPEILEEMLRYSDEHFKTEDALMIESDFPLFGSHRKEHQRYVEKLRLLIGGLQGEQRSLIGEIIDFLADWWVAHINESDRRYVRWILHTRQNGAEGKEG